MMDYIGFQVGFEAYFQDLHRFYGKIENSHGQLIFDKLVIRYRNIDSQIKDTISIRDCLLEMYSDIDIDIFINNMKKEEFAILELNKSSSIPYVIVKDPANMTVKTYFSNDQKVPILNIPYSGYADDIDRFYKQLEVNFSNGMLEIEHCKIDYYSSKEEIQRISDDFEMVFIIDICANKLEILIKDAGGRVIMNENSMMGHFVLATDPARMKLLFWVGSNEGDACIVNLN